MRYYRRNTVTLLAIMISLFVLAGILIWVPGAFDTQSGRYHSLMMTFIVIVPLINSAFQNIFVSIVRRSKQYFFSGRLNEKPIYEAIICISAVVLLPLVPGVTLLAGSSVVETILHMGFWSLIATGSIWISYRTVSVDFYSDLIAIRGINFFKSAGLSQRSMSASGIYQYSDFETYRMASNGFELLLTEQRGHIRFKTDLTQIEPIEAFLKAKGIKRV